MGQSNIWYADQEIVSEFKKEVFKYIDDRIIPKKPKNKVKGVPRQIDPRKRKKIEGIAIEKTIQHYENLGYNVESVEKDNLGWDLEATIDNRMLKLEVKGLSQENVNIELTPNEYKQMQNSKKEYRVCVVTNALKKPNLQIFSYNDEKLDSDNLGIWQDENGNALKMEERISARCYVEY